jgi:hypothetical protein
VGEPLGAEEGRERAPINRTDELIGLLSSRVVGQAHTLEHIVPSYPTAPFWARPGGSRRLPRSSTAMPPATSSKSIVVSSRESMKWRS